jgi:hypothetical protein
MKVLVCYGGVGQAEGGKKRKAKKEKGWGGGGGAPGYNYGYEMSCGMSGWM